MARSTNLSLKTWLTTYCFVILPIIGIQVRAEPTDEDLRLRKEQAEAAKRASEDQKGVNYVGGAPVSDQEKARRKQLEATTGTTQPPQPSTHADDKSKPTDTAPARDLRKEMIEAHDWIKQFKTPVQPSEDLRLTIEPSKGSYRYPDQLYIFVGLQNTLNQQRTLDSLKACGSLARADDLIFRFVNQDGFELLVRNSYADMENRHPHLPLKIDANGRVVDVISLKNVFSSSGALHEFAAKTASVKVSAEFPLLKLRSNQVTIQLPK